MKSKCCKAEMKVSTGDEGTSHYVCESCQRPTDAHIPKPSKTMELDKEDTKNLIMDILTCTEHGLNTQEVTKIVNLVNRIIQTAVQAERERNVQTASKVMSNNPDCAYSEEDGEFYEGFVEGWNKGLRELKKRLRNYE